MFAGMLIMVALSSCAQQQQAEQKFAVTKTDDEWKKILTPEQFTVARKPAPNVLLVANIGTIMKKEPTIVFAAACLCSAAKPSSKAVQAGRVFMRL
jgi:hypothetical protein